MDVETVNKCRRFEDLAGRADRLSAAEGTEFDALVSWLAEHNVSYRAYRDASRLEAGGG
jgi:hypothetical protein